MTQLSKSSGDLPVPITIVPGDLSKERLEAITEFLGPRANAAGNGV